jgi:ElaB/YqjD/DUF883 family membrane-anchored ribosome-binding protein
MSSPGDPVDAFATTDPAEVRRDAEMTRAEMAKTLSALAAKADVKGRAQHKLEETKTHAQARARELSGQAQQRAQGLTCQARELAERNPAALAGVAAAIVLVVVLIVVKRSGGE